MRKYSFLFIIFSFFISDLNAQMVGGRSNGQSSPSAIKASEVGTGGFSGDVSLFTGTYNSSYSLGSVSTPSGLGFSASMTYSSSFASGDNLPHLAGVPYGEGWTIDLPSISVSNEDYTKYTYMDMHLRNNLGGQHNTPIFNEEPLCEEALNEGGLFYFAPKLNIPGIGSGRMVYKYRTNDAFVFVLHKFDRYIEAHFSGGDWEVILDDGTRYYMNQAVFKHRNSSNQRISPDCSGENNSVIMKNLLLPKTEVVSWYCIKINHPNKVGSIHFEYESFGCFDYFKEMHENSQWEIFKAITQYFYPNTAAIGSLAPNLRKVCQEVVLKKVSSDYQQLVLDYDNIPTTGGVNILDSSDGDVTQIDGMFSSKVIEAYSPNNDFENWKRYKHIKSDGENPNFQINPNNPYKGNIQSGALSGNYYSRYNATTNCEPIPFDHSYLESPRIGGDVDNIGGTMSMPPGDLYEVRTQIHSNSQANNSLFDINLATGTYLGDEAEGYVPEGCYEKQAGQSVFSTFNQGIKWFNNSANAGAGANSNDLTTSNFFVMPNLPNQYNGFYIQIGPSNSDNDFSLEPSDVYNQTTSSINVCSTYYNIKYVNHNYYSTFLQHGDAIPHNFGIGLPWEMTNNFYNEVSPLLNPCDYNGNGSHTWWNDMNDPTINYPNAPTQANENITLQSAEIIRYSKTPYMLKTVTFQVFNPDGTISGIADHWQDVSQLSFDYNIEQVYRYVHAKAYGGTPESYQKGKRNIVLLNKIESVAVGSGETSGSSSITRFAYENTNLLPETPTLPTTNVKYNSNFVLLTQIIDPLGKEINISYSPLPNNWTQDNTPTPTNSYVMQNYGFRARNFTDDSPDGTHYICNDYPNVTQIVQEPSYSFQTYMVVDQISVNERIGNGGSKEWTYDFQGGIRGINDRTPFTQNFVWDYFTDISPGFGTTIVTGPSQGGGGPRVEYTHHTDEMLFGKVANVASYDINGDLLSTSSNSYESVLAFESPMIRWKQSSPQVPSNYFDYQIYDSNRPTLEYNNTYEEYIDSIINWLNIDEFTQEYQDWLAKRPTHPIITSSPLPNGYMYVCFDNSDPDDPNDPNDDYSAYFGLTESDQDSCDQYIINWNNWIHDRPENPASWIEHESPDITASSGMYDVADFYEARHFMTILRTKPTYLNSYFIKKTSESSNSFDTGCKGDGSLAVQSEVSYEYWDADYTGKSTSPAYGELGLEKVDGKYQLDWEPSWQLYSTTTTSPQLGSETKEENFYLHDFLNLPQYQRQPGGYLFDPKEDFTLLWQNWAFKKERSMVVQSRVTSQSPSDAPVTRSTYYTYGYGWELDTLEYEEIVITDIPPCNPTTIDGQGGGQTPPIYNPPSGVNGGNGPEEDENGNAPGPSYQPYPEAVIGNIAMLKSVVEQVQEGSNDLITFDESNDWIPTYGVETLTTYKVLSRNYYGQVGKEENEKGLITKFDYDNMKMLKYLECKYYGIGWTWQPLINNVGLPTAVTVGFGLPNALTTTYKYNLDNSIDKVTDPNGIELEYTYDDFGRMTKAYKNGQLIQESAYSNWNNDEGSLDDFATKAQSNSVTSLNYINGTESFGGISYVDPLGRKVASNKVSSGSTVGVEDNIFDIYNRPILQSPPGTSGPTIDKNFANYNTPDASFIYDIAPRSRPTKASKFGESINGNHTVGFTYCLATADELLADLQQANQTLIPAGAIFFKTQTTDEDGKTVIEYTNTGGQKAATITEISSGETAATTFLYNSFGSVKQVSNPKNQISTYDYNYLGQLYEKTTVDGGLTKYTYNPSGQLAVEQDAILAAGHGRLYHYDEFGRMTHQVKLVITAAMKVFENDGNTWIGDSDKWAVFDYFLSNGNNKTEKRWLYDTYTTDYSYAQNVMDYLDESLTSTKGNLVQTISYNLTDDPIEYKFLSYNDDGFLKWEMNQFNQNGMSNGSGLVVRIDYPEYNLQGSNLLQNIDLDGDHTLDFQYKYEYDNWNRIKNVYANYDNSGANGNKIVEYTYDDARGVVQQRKYYHSENDDDGAYLCQNDEIDVTIYKYDARIRLTDLASRFFDWHLYYDENTFGSQEENFNGNINATEGIYKFSDALNPPSSFATQSKYAYSYDGMNRLIQADAELKENNLIVAPTWGNTSYSYDKIGNFNNLQRIAKGASPSILIPTNYTYNYQSGNNQLNTISNLNGGIDRSISYDANGNLLTDTKRGISATTYGRANLPWTQTVNGNGNKYLYDINDARIYKLGVQLGVRGATTVSEFYLRDAAGRELAIYDFNTNKLSWFVHGNERVAKIDHHSDFEFDIPGGQIPPPNDDYDCQCDPRIDPRCNDRYIRGEGFYDKNQINLSDINNTRLINLANNLVDCNDGNTYGTPAGTDLTFYNTTIHYVTKADQSEDYVSDDDIGSLQSGYTIEGTIQIRSRHQQFMMTLNNGQEIPVSIEEMLNLGGTDPPIIGYAGAGDPYLDPLREMTDAPAVSASYYIHDHLGNTRVVYHYSCNLNTEGYTLEHVMDYYPYGKMLQEYNYGTALSERYLTTHHERDVESGLDYRGARFYDSDIGRFLRIDPHAENYYSTSSYAYVLNNPIGLIDPDGRSAESPIYDRDGNFLGVDSEGFTRDIIIMDSDKYAARTKDTSNPLDHEQVMAWAEASPYAQKLNDANLPIDAFANVLTHVTSQLDGESFDGTTLDFSRLEGGKIQIANSVTDDDGFLVRELHGTANNPASQHAGTLRRDNGDINVTAVLQYGKNDDFGNVENTQNILGIHEYYGHGVKKIGAGTRAEHRKVYKLQKKHGTYGNTTTSVKELIKEGLR